MSHRGANVSAFDTIRNHTRGRISGLPGGMYSGLTSGKYVIATEEGRYNVKVYAFSSEDEAREAFGKVLCCRILFDPSGMELDHSGSHHPSFDTIRELVRGRGGSAIIGMHTGLVRGRWTVATEEGPRNVLAYAFDWECDARKFFDDFPCSRILFDASGHELERRGTPVAYNTIRRHMTDRGAIAY